MHVTFAAGVIQSRREAVGRYSSSCAMADRFSPARPAPEIDVVMCAVLMYAISSSHSVPRVTHTRVGNPPPFYLQSPVFTVTPCYTPRNLRCLLSDVYHLEGIQSGLDRSMDQWPSLGRGEVEGGGGGSESLADRQPSAGSFHSSRPHVRADRVG